MQIHDTIFAAAVFDLDGLLLDTERTNKRALKHTFRKFGYRLTKSQHCDLVGLCKEQTSIVLCKWFGDNFDTKAFHEICKNRIAKISEKRTPVKPGTCRLLERLKAAGIPLAVATSNDRELTTKYLRQCRLDKFFASVITRDDVVEGKPHPEIYLRAAQSLNIDPSNCIAFEDSTNGALSAISAGMPTILVPDIVQPSAALSQKLLAIHPNLDSVFRLLKFNELEWVSEVSSCKSWGRYEKV